MPVLSTLRGRLALTYAALIVILIGVLGGALVISIHRLYVDRLSGQLEIQARMVGSAVEPELATGNPVLVDAEVKALGRDVESRFTVIGADGMAIGDSTVEPSTVPELGSAPDVRQALLAAAEQIDRAYSVSSQGLLAVSVPVPSGGGAVARVSVPLTDVNAAVRNLQRIVALGALIAAAVAAAAAIFVAQRISGPLTALRTQAIALAGGDLEASVQPRGPRELRDVASAFNGMTRQVRESIVESERARARLEAIFRNLNDGVVVVDEQHTVVSVNAAAARMLGVGPQAAIGAPFVVVARDADLYRLMRDAFDRRVLVRSAIDHSRSGSIFEALAQPVFGTGERLAIVLIRDVTELRRLELVRREFVANVSHELRTPLASIRAVVETLEAGAIDDPQVAADFLGRIVGEVDRLNALVGELLELGRLESGRMPLRIEPVDVAQMIASSAERLRPQIDRAGLELALDVPVDLPAVAADRDRIEQVLLNLVHNAIKFTPSGGRIAIAAREHIGEVEIRVEDTGPGIPENELNRVFERFYKADKARRSEGTGLGLAIAKHVVLAHGGAIRGERATGGGAALIFTLPAAEADGGWVATTT